MRQKKLDRRGTIYTVKSKSARYLCRDPKKPNIVRYTQEEKSMRQDAWDLDITGMKSSHTFHIGTFDTVAEAEHYFTESKGDFDVAMGESVYCTITRATSWSNSGFIEGLD
jgi:hypothetical protein